MKYEVLAHIFIVIDLAHRVYIEVSMLMCVGGLFSCGNFLRNHPINIGISWVARVETKHNNVY